MIAIYMVMYTEYVVIAYSFIIYYTWCKYFLPQVKKKIFFQNYCLHLVQRKYILLLFTLSCCHISFFYVILIVILC